MMQIILLDFFLLTLMNLNELELLYRVNAQTKKGVHLKSKHPF